MNVCPPQVELRLPGQGPEVKVNIRALCLFKFSSHWVSTVYGYCVQELAWEKLPGSLVVWYGMIVYSLKFSVMHKGKKESGKGL